MLETSNSLACAHDAVWLVTELLFVVPGVTWNLYEHVTREYLSICIVTKPQKFKGQTD